MDGRPLEHQRILVVEDEYYLALDLCEALSTSGADVVGPSSSVDRAIALIGDEGLLDGAVLDMNLGGEMVYPVADALSARGVPFLFTTGYDQCTFPARFKDKTRCEKPVGAATIVEALGHVLAA